MADVIDQSNDKEDFIKEKRIAAIRHKSARRELVPIGICRFCNEPLGEGQKLFCDDDCANDYRRLQRVRG